MVRFVAPFPDLILVLTSFHSAVGKNDLPKWSESEGSEETERSGRDETEDDMAEVLKDVLNKAKMEGWPMYEMIETLAVLGQREREEMLRWYEGKMPREISKGKRDVGGDGSQTTNNIVTKDSQNPR